MSVWQIIILLISCFAWWRVHFFCSCKRNRTKENTPRSQALINSDEGSLVTPDLCGCCGTHELKNEFAQTSSQKAPPKSLPPQLAQWGVKFKSRNHNQSQSPNPIDPLPHLRFWSTPPLKFAEHCHKRGNPPWTADWVLLSTTAWMQEVE